MKRTHSFLFKKIFILLLFVTSGLSSLAQVISKPIPDPTVPSNNFTEICADNAIKNDWYIYYTFSQPSFFAGTVFNLLISDVNGNFPAVPTIIASSLSPGSSANKINFQLPTDFAGGNNYKFKVQSTTTPVITSPESSPFRIYFKVFQGGFSINDSQPLTLCGNTTGTLAIDDPTAEPASITYLQYNWYRNNILIPGQKGTSIPVTLAGTYYCEVDYGSVSCTTSFGAKSSEVVVNIATGGQDTVITSSNPANFVTEGAPATLSTENNPLYFYQWYRDNVVIDGQTTTSITTNQEGNYFLEIYSGICTNRSNEIFLELKKPSLATVIPNLVSPNDDGINDFWEIPETYSSNLNPNSANVSIRDINGKIVYETDNYIGDWPQSSFNFEGINPVFYYLITAKNGEVKKGTITIVK